MTDDQFIKRMNEFPAFPEVDDIIVGRYGVAVRLWGGKRRPWFVLRPNCNHISGPFGTRQKAQRLLDEPYYEGEPQYGHNAAINWLKMKIAKEKAHA